MFDWLFFIYLFFGWLSKALHFDGKWNISFDFLLLLFKLVFLRYQQLTHIGCVCCVYFIYLKYISFAYFYIIMKLKSHIYVIHVAVSQLSYEFVLFFSIYYNCNNYYNYCVFNICVICLAVVHLFHLLHFFYCLFHSCINWFHNFTKLICCCHFHTVTTYTISNNSFN